MPLALIASLSLVLLALLGGCAQPPARPAAVTPQADLARLEKRQQELDAKVSALRGELSQLQAEVQRLQAQPVERRPARVTEKDTPGGEITARVAPPPAPAPPTPTTPAPGTATETYLRAFSDYASGRYPQAIAGFEEFLRAFPDNEYASNAQFWIGECYYAQQDYERAALEFMKMASRYPQSARTPDALFKTASAYQKLGRADEARQLMNLLRERHPQSAAAQKSLEP
ncbi:tol-pal system protein YbgF [Geoalkalibacter sp.]|uniref:tol-pal system protein YbgF n=1 Tax=Geoalkalibacter sp. TaxID=3041440 RepID=UPI00272ED6C1|nr:tol-pal system protein YbgF [Geoalkalibacter sp.]